MKQNESNLEAASMLMLAPRDAPAPLLLPKISEMELLPEKIEKQA